MKYTTCIGILFSVLLLSCGGQGGGFAETNLIEHGVPLTIFAPDSIDVKRSSIGFQEDVTIDGGEDYSVQIFISDAISSQMTSTLRGHRENVESNPFFDGYVEEGESGFVYRNRIDSNNVAYGFRHIVLMGGKEYVFQEAMLSAFNEDQAIEMYKAVQGPSKK